MTSPMLAPKALPALLCLLALYVLVAAYQWDLLSVLDSVKRAAAVLAGLLLGMKLADSVAFLTLQNPFNTSYFDKCFLLCVITAMGFVAVLTPHGDTIIKFAGSCLIIGVAHYLVREIGAAVAVPGSKKVVVSFSCILLAALAASAYIALPALQSLY